MLDLLQDLKTIFRAFTMQQLISRLECLWTRPTHSSISALGRTCLCTLCKTSKKKGKQKENGLAYPLSMEDIENQKSMRALPQDPTVHLSMYVRVYVCVCARVCVCVCVCVCVWGGVLISASRNNPILSRVG